MDYKVMIVAGEGTPGLEKDLVSRNSVDVTHAYNNLISHKKEINTSIVDVSKLIYIIQDYDMPVREDLSFLGELLVNSKSYFKVKEILFLIKRSDDFKQQQEYITIIMKDSKYDNYKIVPSDESFSFIDIYKHALGTTEINKVTNHKRIIYMVERESDVNRAYEPRVTSKKVKPYSYSELENYEKLKRTAVDSESGISIEDRYVDNLASYKDSPEFKNISESNVLIDKNILMFTGRSGSGLTTFALRSALSAMDYSYKLLYVNLADNNDVCYYCKENKVPFKVIGLKEMFGRHKVKANDGELLILDLHDLDDSLKITSVSELVNITNKFDCNMYMYEVPSRLYKEVSKLAGYKISRVFFTILPFEKEVDKLKDLVGYILNKDKKIVHGYKPGISFENSFCKPISREEIKERLGIEKVLIMEYDDSEFNPGPYLFKGIMGV